jgi:hypothetical protein
LYSVRQEDSTGMMDSATFFSITISGRDRRDEIDRGVMASSPSLHELRDLDARWCMWSMFQRKHTMPPARM